MSAHKVRDVAMEAFWRSDPADVSVNAICQIAGVSKPSLYREFGSEDGLTSAVLEAYADKVLSDVFAILGEGRGLRETLDALTDFACDDPRMETGCLFYKMRAGRHRLGPKTLALVEALDNAAEAAYAEFLRVCRERGDWSGSVPLDAAARYLGEQIGLAFSLRAAGEDHARIREMLGMAFSVFFAAKPPSR